MSKGEGLKFLRKCSCGLVALTEDDLELFEVDPHSKHNRRNRCKKCAALKTRADRPRKAKLIVCSNCKEEYLESEAYRFFRRAKPTGDKIVGSLVKVCKKCEATLDDTVYINIGGKLVPADLKELQRNSRITTKPKEVV